MLFLQQMTPSRTIITAVHKLSMMVQGSLQQKCVRTLRENEMQKYQHSSFINVIFYIVTFVDIEIKMFRRFDICLDYILQMYFPGQNIHLTRVCAS